MGLKTNSNQAMSNLYNYIREYSEDYLVYDYEIPAAEVETKTGLYKAIYKIFCEEFGRWNRKPEQIAFTEWAQGLALGGLFCYYYNREAVKDLGHILEETEAEAAKYTEEKAESLLTYLIYREISKEARKA